MRRSSRLVTTCCIAVGVLLATGCGDAPDLAEADLAETVTSTGFVARDVILRLEDVPDGWSEDPADDETDGADEGTEDCFDRAFRDAGLDPDLWDEPGENRADAHFSRARIEFLSALVSQTPEAGEIFETLPGAFAACDGETDADGSTTSVLPVDFPRLADRTFAVRVDAEGYVPLSALYVVVVERDVVVFAVHALLEGAPDPQLLQTSVETMLDRL